MAMNKYVLDGTNGYKVTKTLKSKLIPVGKTRENLERDGVIEGDFGRFEKAGVVKKGINEVHRNFIDRVLSGLSPDFNPLFEAYRNLDNATKETRKAALQNAEKVKKNLRAEISLDFKSQPDFKKLFGINLFKEFIPACCTGEVIEATASFENYYTQFQDFLKLRRRMYEAAGKHNEIAFRIVDDNFPVFYANCRKLELIRNLSDDGSAIKASSCYRKLEELSETHYMPVSNKAIEAYNACISGVFEDDRLSDPGVNQLINEYNQTHPENRLPQFSKLYLNILSEREPLFSIAKFSNTEEIVSSVREFAGRFFPAAEEFQGFLSNAKPEGIVVAEKNSARFSHAVLGDWRSVKQALSYCPKEEKGKPFYSFTVIDSYLKEYYEDTQAEGSFCDEWFSGFSRFALASFWEKIDFSKIRDLRKNKGEVTYLKNFLDEMNSFYRYLALVEKPLEDVPGSPVDEVFYAEYDKFMSLRSEFITLYNMIRNFVTQKLSKVEKVPLHFDIANLGGGWDVDKEDVNGCYVFRDVDDGKTYLGIRNRNAGRISFTSDKDSTMRKMNCVFLGQPATMLPHMFLSKGGIKKYCPSQEILDGYAAGKHTKSSGNFDLEFCHKYIDFCKESIRKYEKWNVFDFKFSDTSRYADVSEFYAEVSAGGFSMSFSGISRSELDKMVDDGKIYLFEVYTRSLSGKPVRKNIHSLMFINAFTDSDFFRLNGGIEVFYRPALIEKDEKGDYITHKKGSVLVNKTTKSGFTIDNKTYMNIYNHFNHGTKLSEDAESMLASGEVIYKVAAYDIIKDKRYTEEQFTLHCPVSINRKGGFVRETEFNRNVLDDLRGGNDMNILAINRGENNLLYAVLMDMKGNILMHRDFNIIKSGNHSVNYRDKLRIRADERDEARHDWQSIDRITDLKEGYLSCVISEIANIMIDNNAVVVMEKLSKNFKSSRACIEENIYQKFEQNLIRKLSCLAFKDRRKDEIGGLRRPYQLVPEFVSMDKIGSQFGCLFFMNPAYVSRFDPETGFANIFRFRDLTNFSKKQAFFKKFDSISMEDGVLTFRYDLSAFDKELKGAQTVYVRGSRNVWNKAKQQHETYDIDKTVSKIIALTADEVPDGELSKYAGNLSFNAVNNGFLCMLLEVFEHACMARTHLGEDNLYVSPSGDSLFNGKSIDCLAAYNLGNKLRYMIKEGSFKLSYTDYMNAVIGKTF